jgi:hypothetical protein
VQVGHVRLLNFLLDCNCGEERFVEGAWWLMTAEEMGLHSPALFGNWHRSGGNVQVDATSVIAANEQPLAGDVEDVRERLRREWLVEEAALAGNAQRRVEDGTPY